MRLIVGGARGRGDTIIEVMFAIAIFSFVAISSLAIMNKGIATGERALEITLARQQVNAQAETLRYIHEARVAMPDGPQAETWDAFLSEEYSQGEASEYGRLASDGNCMIPSGSHKPFILNARTATIWTGVPATEASEAAEAGDDRVYPPYSQVVYDPEDPNAVQAAYGIWVESVPSDSDPDSTGQPFIDFHIRACWAAPGSSIPMTIGTIVRLYDPAIQ